MSQSAKPEAHAPPPPVVTLEPCDADVPTLVAEEPFAEPLTADDGATCEPPEPSMET
jgi:hypothetical protein